MPSSGSEVATKREGFQGTVTLKARSENEPYIPSITKTEYVVKVELRGIQQVCLIKPNIANNKINPEYFVYKNLYTENPTLVWLLFILMDPGTRRLSSNHFSLTPPTETHGHDNLTVWISRPLRGIQERRTQGDC